MHTHTKHVHTHKYNIINIIINNNNESTHSALWQSKGTSYFELDIACL